MRLGEIATFSKGKGISKSDIEENGVTECIRYGELYTYYNETINDVKSKTNVDVKTLVLSESNDIIVPASGETMIDIATASCVLKSGVALGGDLNIIKTKNNGVFLSYYLNSKKKLEIANLAQGISVVHLYSTQLSTLFLNLPQLKEQARISGFIKLLDKRIQTQNKIIGELKTLKNTMIKKMFTQHFRFKKNKSEYFFEWEVKKLGDICIKAKSGGTPKSTIKEFYDGNIPFLSISDMTQQGKYIWYTERAISEEGLYNSNSWIVPANSIIYSMYASIGFVSLNKIELATSQAVLNLIPQATVNNEYLYYYLYYFREFIDKYITTGTQGNLNAETVKNFDIMVPSFEEQIKITSFISSIEDKIEIEKQVLKAYEDQKQYLLQNLFI